ncbi:MAG: hypothetical protein ACW990_19685 [Promethearchaeota archaeon]|jgi:hypothetical protein
MSETKKWVVEGLLAGQIHIPEEKNNLPTTYGELKLTPYTYFIQNLNLSELWSRKIYLGLEIPNKYDNVFIAWQEMETFARALGLAKNVWISVNILKMTDKPEEWPRDTDFLKSRIFSSYEESWQPVDHFRDIKNRVRNLAANPPKGSGGLPLKESEDSVEVMNNPILVNDNYISELIKDYMMGLEEERSHPSLALLYYFKVLERVGKTEFGEILKKGSLSSKTMKKMINEVANELTTEEQNKSQQILRLRHGKSEAHLKTEGLPDRQQLIPCKKMSRFFILRAIRNKI